MAAEILQFPPGAAVAPPIGQFIRIGEAHRKLGDLLAEGRLPATRIVFDASRVRHQKELIEAFRAVGAELVLDPQTAELAALEKFKSGVRNAPWGAHCEHGPLGPSHFMEHSKTDVVGEIARFAVSNGFHVVLAPTHYLADPNYRDWLNIDRLACLSLRRALDKEGGQRIAIDYPILHKNSELKRSDVRSHLMAALSDVPYENLWVRASGLSGDAGPLVTRDFLTSMAGLHNIGVPIIADCLSGFLGAAALAFGAVSGKAHGIAERERFDASAWHKPARTIDEAQKFGRPERIMLPGVGRSVTKNEAEVLASARGGRKLVSCADRDCCSHGLNDMLNDFRRHAITQTFNELKKLEGIPELRREQYFLDEPMRNAVRLARDIKRLNPSEEIASRHNIDINSLMKRLGDHSNKIEKINNTLEDYHTSRAEGAPRARTIGAVRSNSAKQGEWLL